MGKPFVRKYMPSKISEVIGQEEKIKLVENFVKFFETQKKKAILIHGLAGCGKTCCVYALASELGLEVIELNASDLRNKEQINSIVGAASKQQSLFFKGKIILIDELDGIAGRKDYGGIPALIKLIENSAFPIIITANNPFENKFSSLRRKCELLQFDELSIEDVYKILENICLKENIKFDESALKGIARRNKGDARSAINDLQTLIRDNKLSKESLDELGDRDRIESMKNALTRIFKTTDASVAKDAFQNINEDLDSCIFWLDENIPLEYTDPAALAGAYDWLSKADVYRRRIRRWQHWRFLVYINDLITAGVAVSKKEKNKKFVPYKQTGRILKMWWAKQKSMKKKAIAEKIAVKTHTSINRVVKDFEYFKQMFKNKEVGDKLAEELDLDKDEITWLRK